MIRHNSIASIATLRSVYTPNPSSLCIYSMTPSSPPTTRFVFTYLRVSTTRQGQSGLGLEAQREAVQRYADQTGVTILDEYVEIESGKVRDRPQLAAAIAACRKRKATLLIAKLDRLSRNVAFVANLLDGDVEFLALDCPYANKLMIHILAAFAEHERDMISQRTRAALAAAKARGVILGENGRTLAAKAADEALEAAEAYRSVVARILDGGRCANARQLAIRLNTAGIASRAGGRWHATSAIRLMKRLGLTFATSTPLQ